MRRRVILVLSTIHVMSGLLFSQSNAKNVLIVYSSFSGSTKEIVDSMKTYLTNNLTLVDCIAAMKEKKELSKYNLIIIGSAIRGNAPHPQILEFIDINRDALNTKEIAIFAVCGTITSTKRRNRENALTYPDKISHGLKVINKEVFAGNMPSSGKKFDDFMGKFFLGIVAGDFRDWDKIKKWTLELVNNDSSN